ncbi:DUF3489 domain-containing protein [Roseomonas sp. GC11]|uniref:DUF3489 domain-containing protein n=1 Tax=Roseomonas sp. GC11 TaxID=2950546 RepID=UPI00210AB01E|nr:DUF3489 domain-containing protein [Roseomonas sp. GC11]MCQ4162154.1 DUF3489 domain-containing protein [Roseomonas sp. GC11]
MTLSDTQRAILAAAAQHPMHLAQVPARLPAGARQKVAQALLKQALVRTQPSPEGEAATAWTIAGATMALQITEAGLRALGEESAAEEPATGANTAPPEAEEATPQGEEPPAVESAPAAPVTPDDATCDEDAVPTPAPGGRLRAAAAAVLAAWEAEASLEAPMAALRLALAGPASPAPRKPREGTKQEAVLALLRRPEGATIAQICEATGWQQHTVRGFFAGLKRRQGITVIAAERIRQVGPNKEGARGSYSVYRIAD